LAERGVKVEGLRYPDRTTEIGKVINKYISNELELDDRAVHLLFSANRWEQMPMVREKLEAGVTLVVDRYAYSGVAFTAAKGLELRWLKTCDSGLHEPDRVVYMDIPVAEASTRGDYGTERYEVGDFQRKVQDTFDNDLRESWWTVLDARGTLEDLHQKIVELALESIEDAKDKPIKQLWMNV